MSNLAPDIAMLIWYFAGDRSAASSDSAMKTSDPKSLAPLRAPLSLLRMRKTPSSCSSSSPVPSLTESPGWTTTFITRTLVLLSSMMSRALVGLKPTSGMR